MKKEIISVMLITLCLVAAGVAGEIVWKMGGESLVADTIANEWRFNVSNVLVLTINTSGLDLQGNAIENVSNITADYSFGIHNWSHNNYPSACPAGTAVTTIGDATTCTTFLQTSTGMWVDVGLYLQPNASYADNIYIAGDGIFTGDVAVQGYLAGNGIISNNMSTNDGNITFFNSFGNKIVTFHDNGNVSINNNLMIGGNITLYSPDTTAWNCGVNDGGIFSCS